MRIERLVSTQDWSFAGSMLICEKAIWYSGTCCTHTHTQSYSLSLSLPSVSTYKCIRNMHVCPYNYASVFHVMSCHVLFIHVTLRIHTHELLVKEQFLGNCVLLSGCNRWWDVDNPRWLPTPSLTIRRGVIQCSHRFCVASKPPILELSSFVGQHTLYNICILSWRKFGS